MFITATREPSFTQACGMRGVGKTYTTLHKVIIPYIKGDPIKGIKPRKCILIDPNNEFTQFRAIDVTTKNIKLFNIQTDIEARRVSVYKAGGIVKSLDELFTEVLIILENFRGGLLLIEDITLLMGDNADSEFIGRLNTIRHRNCEVIIHFQTVTKVNHPKIGAVTNIIRFHHVSDVVTEQRFRDKTEIMKISEAIVNNRFSEGQKREKAYKIAHPDWNKNAMHKAMLDKIYNQFQRFYVYVHYDDIKIRGGFNEDEFRFACYSYINRNQKQVLKPALESIDRAGKKLYATPEIAIQAVEQRLVDNYYGNI